ncbi:MAG: UvrD-helicase domain-containing protein [bacterium]
MAMVLERPPLLLPLDADQADAAATHRNVLVIAGPGAGKTRVVVGRIQQLLNHGGANGEPVPPGEICCITFTNKAASEIQARLRDHFPAQADEITVRTFHGIARDILREFHEAAGLPKHFHIIDEATQDEILLHALKRHQLQRDPLVLRRLKSHLDLEKSALRHPLTHPRALGDAAAIMPKLFSDYQAFLHDHGVLDFNDLLLAALQVLLTHPPALAAMHARCRYLMLDEFQDVNQVQFELVRLIAGPDSIVLAVADGDQMIYGWRGSNARYLRAFQEEYHADIKYLLRNYRAEEPLQWLARGLIQHNEQRTQPPPSIPAELTNRAATVFHLLTEAEEVRAVEKIIHATLAKDPSLSYRDIAILYRTHGLADRLEKDLALSGVPVQRVRKTPDDPEGGLEHLISYLRLGLHLFDWDLYRAMEYPRRLLSPQENLWLNQAHQQSGEELLQLIETGVPRLSPLATGKLKRFAALVREIHHRDPDISPSAFQRYLITSLGEFRCPMTDAEEAVVLEAALPIAAGQRARIEQVRAFLEAHPEGRLVMAHNGTVTGALAALIASEASRRYLHRPTAIAPVASLTSAQLAKLLGPKGASLVMTFGLTNDQIDELETRIVESGVETPCSHGPVQLDLVERFDVAFETFVFWATFLAEPARREPQEVVVLDTETTGVEPFRCHLLQVAAERVDLTTGEVKDTFLSFLKPPEHIPSKVQELTGITDAMVEDAPSPSQVIPELLAFLGDAPLVGHNLAGFDLPILRRYAMQAAKTELHNLPLDTLLWSRDLFPRQNHTLEALASRFHIVPEDGRQAHQADVDVWLVRQLWPVLTTWDALKRGLLFSQVAHILLALASFQDDAPEDLIRKAVREGAKRIIQRVEQDDRDIAMLLGRHFDEFQSQRLLGLVKEMGRQPLEEDLAQDRFEQHIRLLQDLILRYEDAGTHEGLRGFLDYYYLLNDQDYLNTEDTVKLLTVHAAKGLEFEVVILVGMEQGSFPHYLAVNNIHRIEEERRLLYVALTRARRKVYLTYVQARHGRFRPPSMFLKELPRQLVRIFKSDKVEQLEKKPGSKRFKDNAAG